MAMSCVHIAQVEAILPMHVGSFRILCGGTVLAIDLFFRFVHQSVGGRPC